MGGTHKGASPTKDCQHEMKHAEIAIPRAKKREGEVYMKKVIKQFIALCIIINLVFLTLPVRAVVSEEQESLPPGLEWLEQYLAEPYEIIEIIVAFRTPSSVQLSLSRRQLDSELTYEEYALAAHARFNEQLLTIDSPGEIFDPTFVLFNGVHMRVPAGAVISIAMLPEVAFIQEHIIPPVPGFPVPGFPVPEFVVRTGLVFPSYSTVQHFVDNLCDSLSSWAEVGVITAITNNLVPRELQLDFTQPITRAEFCSLAVLLYEGFFRRNIAGRVTFVDTDDVNVEKMAYIGVVSGVGDNMFAPNEMLTREQAAVMLSRLAEAIVGQSLEFSQYHSLYLYDNEAISLWALEGVLKVVSHNIMSGVGMIGAYYEFAPQQVFTREQSIITMLRLIHELESTVMP